MLSKQQFFEREIACVLWCWQGNEPVNLCGTGSKARSGRLFSDASSCSASAKPSLGKNGNGCAGSIASGRQNGKDLIKKDFVR